MKSRKELKGRVLADQELKATQGGMSTPPPSPDPTSDARAVVIETGKS